METEDRMNERSFKCLEHSATSIINYPKTMNTVLGVVNLFNKYFLSIHYVTEIDITHVPMELSI